MAATANAEEPQDAAPFPLQAPDTPSSSEEPSPSSWPLRARLGVRAGWLAPSFAGDPDFESGWAFGLWIGLAKGDAPRVSVEIGVDTTRIESIDEAYVSYVLIERLELLVELPCREGPARPYVLAGGSLIEEVVEEGKRVISENYSGAVNVGAGAWFLDSRLDVRLTHSFLVGAENATGLTWLTVSYRF